MERNSRNVPSNHKPAQRFAAAQSRFWRGHSSRNSRFTGALVLIIHNISVGGCDWKIVEFWKMKIRITSPHNALQQHNWKIEETILHEIAILHGRIFLEFSICRCVYERALSGILVKLNVVFQHFWHCIFAFFFNEFSIFAFLSNEFNNTSIYSTILIFAFDINSTNSKCEKKHNSQTTHFRTIQ